MPKPDHSYLAQLVLRSQNDDSDAFAELYSLTYNKVYNYACHYLRDVYLAQDAVQEVYICALKNISKLNDPLLFVAWLNQISFRTCFDMSKKRNEKYGTVDDIILEQFSDDHIYSNPEEQVLHNDQNSRLTAAINQLPLLEKQIIILKYYNNMIIDDIASAIDVSKSTIKRHMLNAQDTLKNLLEE